MSSNRKTPPSHGGRLTGILILGMFLCVSGPLSGQLLIPKEAPLNNPKTSPAPPPAADGASDKSKQTQPSAAPVVGPLEVSPARLTLGPDGKAKSVQVTAGGAPVPGQQLSVSIKGNYGWMFDISKPGANGTVTIRPKPDKAEFGDYELIIAAGTTKKTVAINYGNENNASPKTAPKFNPKYSGMHVSPFRLNPEYTVGTGLSLSIDGPPELYYEWLVNGTRYSAGIGQMSVTIKTSTTGPLTITLIVSSEGNEITRCDSHTTMVGKR